MDYKALYEQKKSSIDDFLAAIRSGDVIVSPADCAEARTFFAKLHTIAPRVQNVTVAKGANNMYDFISEEGMAGHFETVGYYHGPAHRKGDPFGNVSYVPCDIPCYEPFFGEVHPCTVFVAAVSPMNDKGQFSIGLARQWGDEFIKTADRVFLEVNRELPFIEGGMTISIEDVTGLVEVDYGLWDVPTIHSTPEELAVAQNCRELLRDGDCIQLGIGGLPNAIAKAMYDLKDLGIHTEMMTATMGEMIRMGIVTGERKNFNKGLHIACFAGGDRALYDTVATNPNVRMIPGTWTVDPMVIMQNDNMVSINTCIEMDLCGQITAESIGARQFSGSGGAFDFAYGALRSKGGRGIYAFTSLSKKGQSKIKSILAPGAQITIPRNYADYIVTEYGIAPLRGRSVRERTKNLIAIAHPDFRAELTAQAKELNYI